MHLVIECELGAPPAAVWSYVTEPDRMNEWSRARIDGLSTGADGSFSAVGALRRVRLPLPGFSVVLKEVVEDVEFPSRFVYRVVSTSFPFTSHRGEIRLDPCASGSRLRWTVEAVFPFRLFDWAARRILTREIGRSLETLRSLFATARTITEDGEVYDARR